MSPRQGAARRPTPPPGRAAPRATRAAADVAGWALTLALVLAWALLLRPGGLHGPATYALVSGSSMEPTLRGGDLVVAHRQDRYRRGDVVLFRIPGTGPEAGLRVVHRIVGGSAATGFRTRGDNRDTPDFWRPRPADIDGRVRAHVPRIGTVLVRLRSDLGVALFAGVLAFGVLGGAARRPGARPPGA